MIRSIVTVVPLYGELSEYFDVRKVIVEFIEQKKKQCPNLLDIVSAKEVLYIDKTEIRHICIKKKLI